jgi:hypothetical protein
MILTPIDLKLGFLGPKGRRRIPDGNPGGRGLGLGASDSPANRKSWMGPGMTEHPRFNLRFGKSGMRTGKHPDLSPGPWTTPEGMGTVPTVTVMPLPDYMRRRVPSSRTYKWAAE